MIIILFVLLAFSVLLNFILVMVTVSSFSGMDVQEDGKKFSEEFMQGSGRKKIVRIDVFGIITFQKSGGMLFQEQDLATLVMQQIDAAEKDPNVVGILLVVDSPGGGITASDIIYERLLSFKKSGDGDRKVVALMRDLAASGGYYISAASDKIVAHRTTITGSIGVIISSPNFTGLADKIGITDVTIKSGKNKDMLNPLRTPTAEETNILQITVNDMYDRFVSVVARSRNLEPEKVREIADGRIYTARQALELSLIDEIGDVNTALDQLREMTGHENVKVIRYKRSVSFAELFLSRFNNRIQLPFPPEWSSDAPRFMYLWKPNF